MSFQSTRNLLGDREDYPRGNDVWRTYNRLQENLISGGVKGVKVGDNGSRRRVTTRPVKALDKNLKLNQALWVVTQKMAELG